MFFRLLRKCLVFSGILVLCWAWLPDCSSDVAIGTIGIPTAHAFSYVEMSLAYASKTADRIVVATPTESKSLWENDGRVNRIVTYYRVRIDTDIVGSGDQFIWIRTLGGVVDKIGQRVFGAVALTLNRPALLFLSKQSSVVFSVLEMQQGHFPIVQTKDIEGKDKMQLARRRVSHFVMRQAASGAPVSVLEGASFEDAKRLILEARRSDAP